jgi:hypothetical protein
MFIYLLFYVPLKNFSLIWRRHDRRWSVAKFRPVLDAQGLWTGRDLYRATPAVKRGLSFSSLIRRTAQFSRLLRHTRGCGGSILTRILTGGLVEWHVLNSVHNIRQIANHVIFSLKLTTSKSNVLLRWFL